MQSRTTVAWLSAALLMAMAGPAAAAPKEGNTAFLMICTVLVLLMTIPGLALFYGGLVRSKNMLATMMHVFATVCLVCVIWLLYGYSLAFTNGGVANDWIGGFSKAFLADITPNSTAATFSNGVYVPEFAFICFQMTFAAITPALIVGAFAERMRFAALLLFMALWVTFIYCPIAHMVWYWAGPDPLAAAAKTLQTSFGQARLDAQAVLDFTLRDSGAAFQWGTIDFAGGTVVHVNAGIAGLVGAIMLGRRVGYGREAMPPHSLAMCMIGACLLWVGWFGFNAGSNLEANGIAALAMINTFGATATAALGWMMAEWIIRGKPTVLGVMTGVVAGLVAVTPASGFAGPMGAMVLGAAAGIISFLFCTGIKNAFGYDDTLDVFGVHCIAGIIGALGTGLLVNPEYGGTGVSDYISKPGSIVIGYDMMTQVLAQSKAVGLTLIWSGVGSVILFKVVDVLVGLRPPVDQERDGLDITDHGERAYNF